ncbi:MAG: hypothetical protein ACFHW5_17580 [Verrucomicrobiota bacterium]
MNQIEAGRKPMIQRYRIGLLNPKATFWLPLAIFTTYLATILWQHFSQDDHGLRAIAQAHLKNIQTKNRTVKGLIFGGSNAVYGLSAELLSQETSIPFYNVSLIGGGISKSLYEDYIEEISSKGLLPEQIECVVYSTILPLRPNAIERYLTTKGYSTVWGRKRFNFRLSVALGEQLYRRLFINQRPRPDFSLPSEYGDMFFDLIPCDLTDIQGSPTVESPDLVVDFYDEIGLFLKNHYMNASIYFIIPSEYYRDSSLPKTWKTELDSLWKQKGHQGIHLIFQDAFPDTTFLCDSKHHANAKGRQWRTLNLIDKMNISSKD